jgi:hypothetical protein
MFDSHNGQSQIQRAQSKPKDHHYTGERIPGFKYQLIVDAAGREEPVARIARQVGVDRATATAIIQRESRTIQQRKQELLDQSLRIARRAANQIEAKINDKATLSQLVPVYGCATDKVALLSAADPFSPSQHLHLHLQPNDVTSNFNKLLARLEEKARALPPSPPPASPTRGKTPSNENHAERKATGNRALSASDPSAREESTAQKAS